MTNSELSQFCLSFENCVFEAQIERNEFQRRRRSYRPPYSRRVLIFLLCLLFQFIAFSKFLFAQTQLRFNGHQI